VRAAPLALCAIVAYVGVGGSCASPTTPYDDVDQWLCFQSEDVCDCYGRPAGTRIENPREPTPGCAAELDCCFVKDKLNGDYDCKCVAIAADDESRGTGGEGGADGELSRESRCLLAAAEYGTTTVTAHCPPLTLDSPGVCALTFESCEPAYLEKNGLVACCEGLACQLDSTGQRLCR
jgi:hypothetical protein